jgi:hypothetical protein
MNANRIIGGWFTMIKYPVRFSVPKYQGADPRQKAQNIEQMRIGKLIQDWLNNKAEASASKIISINYIEIADALSLAEETVKAILYPVDFGHNGITIERS